MANRNQIKKYKRLIEKAWQIERLNEEDTRRFFEETKEILFPPPHKLSPSYAHVTLYYVLTF